MRLARAKIYGFPSMISQVAHFFDVMYRMQAGILEAEGLGFSHVAILRRLMDMREGGWTYDDLSKSAELSHSYVSRLVQFLDKSDLVSVASRKVGDRSIRTVHLTQRGRRLVGKLDAKMQDQLLKTIGAKLNASRRVFFFTRHLWRANGFLPPDDVANHRSYRRSKILDDTKNIMDEVPRKMDEVPREPDDGEIPY